jgi:hypothetical protein
LIPLLAYACKVIVRNFLYKGGIFPWETFISI